MLVFILESHSSRNGSKPDATRASDALIPTTRSLTHLFMNSALSRKQRKTDNELKTALMSTDTEVVKIQLERALTSDVGTDATVLSRLNARLKDMHNISSPASKDLLAKCRNYLSLDTRTIDASVLQTMRQCKWLKDVVDIMKSTSKLDYFLFAHLLYHPEFPAHVVQYSALRVNPDVVRHVVLADRIPPQQYHDTELWTDVLKAYVTVAGNDESLRFNMTLKPNEQKTSNYKILARLCSDFEVFSDLRYESFNAERMEHTWTMQVTISFVSPPPHSVQCALFGSCDVALGCVWRSNGDVPGELRMEDPECYWRSLHLYNLQVGDRDL